MPTVELQISALPAHVRTARLIAASLGRRLGLDAVTIDEVKLAVGEACSRAVGVHQAAQLAEPIVVQFQDDDEILEIRVLDCAQTGTALPGGVTPDGVLLGGSTAAATAAADELLQAAARAADAPSEPQQTADAIGLESRLGLAVIAGLVDDMSVAPRSDNGEFGSVITMRWPIVSF